MDGMSDVPGMPEGFDPQAFADTPLFREIQRVLSSSSGPVNWELARQVGIAGAQDGREDPTPSDLDRHDVEEAVRVAELQVTRFTGLEPPHDVPAVRPVRRAEWVSAAIESLGDLIEPAATRAGRAIEQIAQAGAAGLPEEQAAAFGGGAVLAQLSPLLMGAQVGSVLGYLGQRAFGQFDVPVPRESAGSLQFVTATIEAFERDWSLDRTEFLTAVALHEVAHRFEFSRPWAPARFRELLEDFLSTLQLDTEALRQRIQGLDAADPEAMQQLMEGEEGLFGTVLDDEQRIKLGRIQAFMAASEGWADHVAASIGEELLPSHRMIEEALRRHREADAADPVFERLLGVEMKREQYVSGRTFCGRVAELTDEATLGRMWDSPEALPSLPEIEEPRLWLARSV
jgi:putative hydrolase